MINNILISRETRKVLSKDNRFIGIEGENLQEVLVFNLDEELEGSAIIEIQFKDGIKGFIELDKTERGYELPIKSSLLTQEGLIKMQLRIVQLGQEVFKSEIIRFDVDKAINATATIPDEYPTWIDNLGILKLELQKAENERIKAEQDRVNAENERVRSFSQMGQDVENAIKEIEDKKADYNDNALKKVAEYDKNAQDKLDVYNANTTNKIKEFNDNVTTQTNTFNKNAETQITEYNENAQAKIDEYNANAETKKVELEDIVNSVDEVSLGQLNDKLLYDLYKKVTADDISWKNVTIYNGSGDNTVVNTAITSDYVYMKKGSVIKFYNIDIYRSRITLYDLNKTYVKNTGTYASRESYTLDSDCYVRVGFDRIDKGNIPVTEGNSNNVDFEGYDINDDAFKDKIIDDLYEKVVADDLIWTPTTIYQGNESSDANAITSEYIFVKKGTRVIFNDYSNYKNRITIYDIYKNYRKNTGTYANRECYIVEEDCYIRIGLNKAGISIAEGNSINVSVEGYLFKLKTDEEIKQEISDYDMTIKNINHRGYNTIAPENTLPAYRLSKQKGFKYVECDVSFTSDDVPVLLHDATIDRTSNGTGNINELTFDEVRALDFGSWKSSDYTGELIPSFEEFIALCRNIGLYPYIEIKSNVTFTETQIQTLVNIVKKYGMINKVTWLSFSKVYLGYVKNHYPKARLGYVVNSITDEVITTANNLKNDVNKVFVNCNYSSVTEEIVNKCISNDIPLEVWTVNTETDVISLNPYVSGVTSESLMAGKILYIENMEV